MCCPVSQFKLNNFFRSVNTLSELYFVSSLTWELLIVLVDLTLFVMMHINQDMIFLMGPAGIMETAQYFCISMISTMIKDATISISEAIYDSYWYWLSVAQKRDVLKILTLAQQPKALHIGPFGEANFERFTNVIKFIYNVCLMLNFSIQQK